MTFDFSADKVPIFPNINDKPDPPTTLKAGNGSHLISLYNKLIDNLTDALGSLETNNEDSISSLQEVVSSAQNSFQESAAALTSLRQQVQEIQLKSASQQQAKLLPWLILTDDSDNNITYANPGSRFILAPQNSQPINIRLFAEPSPGSEVYFLSAVADVTMKINLPAATYKGQQCSYLTFNTPYEEVGLIAGVGGYNWIPTVDNIFIPST